MLAEWLRLMAITINWRLLWQRLWAIITTPCADIFSQDTLNWSHIFFRDSQICLRCAQLRCSQMLTDVFRCFWILSRYSIDVLSMFSRCSLDVLRMFAGFSEGVFRMLSWVLWAWWNLMIISNESMDFIDPKEFDDPR